MKSLDLALARRIATVVVAAGALTLTGLVAAAPAHALAAVVMSMSSGSTTVHTANGKAWRYSVSASPQPSSTADVAEGLVRTRTRPVPSQEIHGWDVTVPASALTFDATSGHGTLKTPHSVAALTTLDLTFTTTSRRQVPCAVSGSLTYYSGTLAGTAILATHLRAGGTVGASHLRFPTGAARVVTNSDCEQAVAVAKCDRATSFQADGSDFRSLLGSAENRSATIELDDLVNVSAGSALRSDEFITRSARLPVYNARTQTLRVWAAASGPFTGTATFTGGRRKRVTSDCVVNGVHHTQLARSVVNATFRNGATHPLVAHTSLVGAMTIPTTRTTGYSFDSWK